MERYQREVSPFYANVFTDVYLYHGQTLSENRPVVIKEHLFNKIQLPESQKIMNRSLNAALAQAKLRHPNVCEILELRLETEAKNCSVFHVLEALETDLLHDIERRKRTNASYTVEELREMTLQVVTALVYAHSKRIAHRDIKPSNIFRTGATYKLGDFGCFFIKRDTSNTESPSGDQVYMSPQLYEACRKRTPYNAFKTDIFALGATLLHMMTRESPKGTVFARNLKEAVQCAVRGMHIEFQVLVCSMMEEFEENRPTAMEIYTKLAKNRPFTCEPPPTPIPSGERSLSLSSPSRVATLPKSRFSHKTPEAAVVQYFKSIAIYSTYFPDTLNFPDCLSNFGCLYRDINRYTDSEAQYL